MSLRENPESDWFGYQQTSPQEKTERVGHVFSSVAQNYDLMNDLMSGGLHRLWKNHFVSLMNPCGEETILDIAGGTGDIAIRCHKKAPRTQITVCDINKDMMDVGQKKAIDAGILNGINWVKGNAEALPFEDNSADVLCISFGLRNVTHIDTALREFARVLKKGGRFFCMEFTPRIASPLQPLYDAYSFSVLPWLGQHIAHDREAYSYLAESIRKFPDPEDFTSRIKKAGFEAVTYQMLLTGVAAIHSGKAL
ncbi:MAG: bifunctional demethylmenaquinone methyltransferase/2-methoxy-6-polyprenyl-1,4-benzoquinol methylase UbiE [Bdellovibrionales bacterium]